MTQSRVLYETLGSAFATSLPVSVKLHVSLPGHHDLTCFPLNHTVLCFSPDALSPTAAHSVLSALWCSNFLYDKLLQVLQSVYLLHCVFTSHPQLDFFLPAPFSVLFYFSFSEYKTFLSRRKQLIDDPYNILNGYSTMNYYSFNYT